MVLLNILRTINEPITRIVKKLMTVILFGVLIVMAVNVVTRYMFSYSFSFTEEIGGIALVWMVYLGSGIVARKGEHLSIDTLYNFSPRKIKWIFDSLLIIGMVMMTIVLIYVSGHQVLSFYNNPQYLTASDMPMYIAYAVIPFGFMFILLGTLEFFFKKIIEKEK